ncbi:MAG: phosphotransferase [Thermacetogeniaceae bacterium]
MERKEDIIFVESSIDLSLVGQVIQLVGDIPFFKEKSVRVKRISKLPYGLTNFNFKVTVDGENYAVRIAAPGSWEYIDRVAEKHNATLMAEIGVSPKVYYYNEKRGDQVCEYIDGKTLHIEDFRDPEIARMAAALFRKYHNCGKEFVGEFNPFKVKDDYLKIVKAKNVKVYDEHDQIWDKAAEIEETFKINPPRCVPCHNDPLAENWLLDQRGMWLIDWEYGGMNDPMFDVGDFISEVELPPESERAFLEEYFEGKITWEDYGRVVLQKYMCNALWELWSLVQIANDKPFKEYWEFGLSKVKKAMRLMNSPVFEKCMQAVREGRKEPIELTDEILVSLSVVPV